MSRVLGALFLGLLNVGALAAAEPRRPNILFIVADDLGYADLAFQGGRDIPTPHLDSLASGGVRCTQGYVSGPYCSPTRAGLLTGRYQQRFGHEFNPGGAAAEGLPRTERTLADRLREAGYATGLVGKWHLGGVPELQPPQRGFQEFFGFLGGAHPYFPGRGAPIYRGTREITETEYLTDAIGREAVAFIDRHQAKPFFLYVAFNAVHTPMEADDARLQKFASIPDTRRRTYAAMLWAMDQAVGRVLAKVRSANLEQDTLIAFISDNGGPTMTGTTINASRNTPLRGGKRTTLEGGIRVPFVVSWKGRLTPGTYTAPVIQLDLHTTSLVAAGVTPRAEWKLDGVDLMPYFQNPDRGQPHERLYWRFGPQMAIRQDDWKLVRYDPQVDRDAGKTPEMEGRATRAHLYNLAKDIGESQDMSASEPAKLKELQSQWDRWNATLVEPLWGAPAARRVGKAGKADK